MNKKNKNMKQFILQSAGTFEWETIEIFNSRKEILKYLKEERGFDLVNEAIEENISEEELLEEYEFKIIESIKIKEIMNKPILVFYINVDGMTRNRAYETIQEYFEVLSDDKDVKVYVIAVVDQPAKVECVNFKLIGEEEYKRVDDILSEYQQKTLDFIKEKVEG